MFSVEQPAVSYHFSWRLKVTDNRSIFGEDMAHCVSSCERISTIRLAVLHTTSAWRTDRRTAHVVAHVASVNEWMLRVCDWLSWLWRCVGHGLDRQFDHDTKQPTSWSASLTTRWTTVPWSRRQLYRKLTRHRTRWAMAWWEHWEAASEFCTSPVLKASITDWSRQKVRLTLWRPLLPYG